MKQDNLNLQRELQALRTRYLETLPDKLLLLREAWARSCDPDNGHEAMNELAYQAHNLAGSGATFGCPEVSKLAREIYVSCQTPPTDTADDASEMLEKLLLELEAASRRAIERLGKALAFGQPPTTCMLPSPEAPCIYLVDDDAFHAERIADHLRTAGYQVRAFETIEALDQAASAHRPAAILSDMVFKEGTLAGAQATSRYARELHIPVVFLSMRRDMEARLAAIRAGASHYLVKPAEPAQVIAALDRLTARPGTDRYHILLVDDDVQLSELYRVRFEAAGMETSVLNDPVAVLSTLAVRQPDLILLDINMPNINGLELGALIRQDEEYNHIPIVFLSADASAQNQLACMHLGADDLLDKRIDPGLLTQAIRTRALRARSLRDGRASLQRTMRHLEFMHHVLDQHAIVATTDLEGRITFSNQKFSDISGYSPDELLGQNHRILKSGRHDDGIYEELWDAISSGKTWQGVLTNRAKDGHLYDVATTIVPRLDDSGLPEQYVAVRTDVTALKELERKLQEREELLRSILDNAPVCIKLLDAEGRVVQMNAAGLAMIEADEPEKVIGQNVLQLVMPEHRAEFLRLHRETISGTGGSLEFEIDGLKGTRRTLFTETVPLHSSDGTVIGALGVTTDISERKLAEAERERLRAQLIQAQKMESIGHLTAGVAHDFNNLLGGILGFAELAQESIDNPQATDRMRNYLGQVVSAGTRAKDLISQMLIFSRLRPEGNEQGDAPVILLEPVLKEVVHLGRSSIPSSITVNYAIEDSGLKARIQPVHLHQILLNLIINARDAMGEFGQIDVIQSRREASGSCDSCHTEFCGEYAEILIRDTGHGIAEHLRDKIFDPFFTTKDVGKGSGMGLAVVHGIVHGLGGHLEVSSVDGQGTAIRILLPLAGVESAAEVLEPGPAAKGGEGELSGVRVMVVDDEHAMASMLTELISLHGASVETYHEPERALAAFEKNPHQFDIVITDATMPELSGLELARGMLQLRPGLPLLLCTGYSDHINQEIAHENGIAAFMYKPLDIPKILAWIQAQKDANNAVEKEVAA